MYIQLTPIMTQQQLESTIQRIIDQHNIVDVNIEGVKKDYKFFSTSSELDEQLILNLIYRNMKQDIIRRTGSKRVLYYSTNPTGSFVPYKKDRITSEFLSQSLSQSFLASHLSPRQMRNIVSCLKPVDIPKNIVLITEDGIGSEMYVIEKGSFEITKNDKLVEIRRSGIVGEMALLHSIRRTATVRSLEMSKLWCLTLEEYIAIVETSNFNQANALNACINENSIFEDKRMVRKNAKYAYLETGAVLDGNFYYIVVFEGSVLQVDGENVCLRPKDVVDSGVVVKDLEVYIVEKKFCVINPA